MAGATKSVACTGAALILGLGLAGSGLANSADARLNALKTRVTAIAAETTYVEAIVKIQRLGRAFGYYTDKGYFAEAADLFTDDATFQWGMDGVYNGQTPHTRAVDATRRRQLEGRAQDCRSAASTYACSCSR